LGINLYHSSDIRLNLGKIKEASYPNDFGIFVMTMGAFAKGENSEKWNQPLVEGLTYSQCTY
jgi:hypothetical protein